MTTRSEVSRPLRRHPAAAKLGSTRAAWSLPVIFPDLILIALFAAPLAAAVAVLRLDPQTLAALLAPPPR